MKDRHTDPSSGVDSNCMNVNSIQNGQGTQNVGKAIMNGNDLDKDFRRDKINDLSKATSGKVQEKREPEEHNDWPKEKSHVKVNGDVISTTKYQNESKNNCDIDEFKLSHQMEKLSVSRPSPEDNLIEAASKLSLSDDTDSSDERKGEVTLNGEVQPRGPSGGVPRILPFPRQNYKTMDPNLNSYQPVKCCKGGKRTMDSDEFQDSYQKYTKPYGDINPAYNFPNFPNENVQFLTQTRDNSCVGKMLVKSPTTDMPQPQQFPQDGISGHLDFDTDKFLEELFAGPGSNEQVPMMNHGQTDARYYQSQMPCSFPFQTHDIVNSPQNNGLMTNVNVNMLSNGNMVLPTQNGYQDFPTRNTQTLPEMNRDTNFSADSFNEMQSKNKQGYISETESDMEKSPYSLTSPGSVSSVSLNSPPPSNLSHDSGYGGMNALSPASDYIVKSPPSRPPSKSGTSPPSDSSGWSDYSMTSPSPENPTMSKSDYIDQNWSKLQDVYNVIVDDMKHDNEVKRQQNKIPPPQMIQQNHPVLAVNTASHNRPQKSPPVITSPQRVMPVKVANPQVIPQQNGFPPQPVTSKAPVAPSQQQNAPVIILPPATRPQINGNGILHTPTVSQPVTTSTGSFVIVPGSAPGVTSTCTPVPITPTVGTTPQNTIIIVAQQAPLQQPQKEKPKLREIRPKLPNTSGDAKNGTLSPTSQKNTSPGTNGPKLIANHPAQRSPAGSHNQNSKQMDQRQRQNMINVARRMVADISRDQLPYQDEEGDTYLHVAVCKTDPNMVRALLERLMRENMSSMIDVENNKRQTPLYLAVVANQAQMVRMFLESNANPNTMAQVKLQDGNTMVKAPIHAASSNGVEFLQTLQELLKSQDLSLNIENSDGLTALHCAIQVHGRQLRNMPRVIDSIPIIQALIKAGADPRSQDKKSGKTPLMYAIEKRDYSLVETIIRLFEPSKLRNIVRLSTFDNSSCLKIAESLKNDYPPEDWQKLMNLLSAAYNGQLPPGLPSF